MRQRSVIIKSFLIALSFIIGINASVHARYYEPTMGRFISPDTIVPNANDPQSLNRYSYVRNNPVVLTDPDGHFFVVPILIAAAVSAAVNATMAATNGANSSGIWTATWQGAVQGAVFAGTIAMGGGPFLGGALSGALGGALNGGGTEGAFQGAAFGAFTASVSSQVPVPKNAWAAAATRIGVGAGAGGAVAAAMGGSVREGATQGALYAAVSMAYSGAASFSANRSKALPIAEKQKPEQLEFEFTKEFPEARGESGLVIGRGEDLHKYFDRPNNKSLPGEYRLGWGFNKDKMAFPKTPEGFSAEFTVNEDYLGRVTSYRISIKDISPSNNQGIFLNNERHFLESAGYRFENGVWRR